MDQQFKEERTRSDHNIYNDMREQGERLSRFGRDTTINEFDRISSALHTAADRLHGDKAYFAGFFDTLADSADRASHFLKEHEPGEIMDNVKDFSRHNPYLAAGGMFVAGLALSRFFKAGTTDHSHYKEDIYEHDA
jgi:hypothetical protein